jgi:hypothetical protein
MGYAAIDEPATAFFGGELAYGDTLCDREDAIL